MATAPEETPPSLCDERPPEGATRPELGAADTSLHGRFGEGAVKPSPQQRSLRVLRATGGSAPRAAGKEAGLLPPAREGSHSRGTALTALPGRKTAASSWTHIPAGPFQLGILHDCTKNKCGSITPARVGEDGPGRELGCIKQAASSKLQTLQSNVGLLPAAQTAPSLPFDPAAHLKHFCLSCERFVVISGQSPVCH